MKGASYTIDAQVKLLPTFSGQPGNDLNQVFAYNKKIQDQLRADLLDVTITSSIYEPAARFSFTLAARPVLGMASWGELIRPYALVTILLHRAGHDAACTPEPEPMLIGLVDPGGILVSEDYQDAEPHRTVRISGRSLAGVLTDQSWWYNHYLATQPPPEMADFFADDAGFQQSTNAVQEAALGFFAVDPELFTDLPRLTPAAAMGVVYKFFVGTPEKPGFIHLQFDDKRPLRDRLVFDEALALRSFFDPAARFMQQTSPTQFPQQPCWGAMHLFAEDTFVEMFTDTFGTSADDAACHLVVRKPPWAGHIAYPNDRPSVAFSTGKAPGFGSSLFDQQFGGWGEDNRAAGWNGQPQTVLISGSDVISIGQLVRGSGPIFNTFCVRPQIGGPSGNSQGDTLLNKEVPPIIDNDPNSPSYILRWGIRQHPFQSTKYIPVVGSDNSTRVPAGGWGRHCAAYGALLRSWLHWNPEMWSGVLVLKGRTSLRIGRRLMDTDVGREYYITGATHHLTLTGQQPTYTATVQVERGWEL